jgi:hypothetical protein
MGNHKCAGCGRAFRTTQGLGLHWDHARKGHGGCKAMEQTETDDLSHVVEAYRSDLARVTAERDRLAREVSDLNDSVGVIDTCQIKVLIDAITAERDAARVGSERLHAALVEVGQERDAAVAEVEAMRAVVEAAAVVASRLRTGLPLLAAAGDMTRALDALRARKVVR